MEFLNWENILLEWVKANRLEFFARPCHNLKLAEIESFYNEFKTKVTSVNIASKSLDSFMKHFYPEFGTIYNEEGIICPDDYVYGYSLLMFFSCVTHPDEKMHKICKTMQEETQLIIKTFLQNLLECNSFTREAIKAVIQSSGSCFHVVNLISSPSKTNEVDTIPPTPKTKILNEWYTENRKLKAQVETEQYEKGFLEMQLKEKEEQINVLAQERRKFVTEIRELKHQISEKDLANIPPNDCTEMESLKRRLRKEVAEKDEEIKDLESQVKDLTTAEQHLAEKLSYVQSQYNISIASTNDLTVRLDDVSKENEKQLQHIKGLEIAIKEYQKYFNESNSKGNSLNASSDNLDDSYAKAMANISNRSMTSPENLGKVVDIQLREQVLLNENLLNQYNSIQKEKSVLNEQIEERAQKISALESKCRQIEDENSSHVKRYEDKLEELAALSKESEANLKELQLLRIEFDSLMSKVNESHQRIEDLNDTKSSLEHQLHVSENTVTELRATNQTMTDENVNHLCHIKRLAASEKKLKSELDNSNDSLNCLQSSIVQLKDQLEKSHEREVILQSEVDDLLTQIDRLKADNQTLSEDYTVSLNDKDVALKNLEADRNALMIDLERQVQLVRELTVQIHSEKAKLFRAELSKTDLIFQYVEIRRQSNSKLAEIEKERDSLSAQVSELKTCLSDAEAIKMKLLTQNGELVMEMEKEKNVLSSEVRNLSANLVNVQTSRKNDSDSLNEVVLNLKNQIQRLEEERQIFDETLTELTTTNQLVSSENAQLRKQLSTIEAMRVDESENGRMQLEKHFEESEMENQKLQKLTADLEAKRDELMIGIESAERELVNSREDTRLKNQELAVLLNKIDELKSESTTAVAEKSMVEANLQNNLDLLKQLTEELDQNKVDLGEKLKLIDSLSDQIAQLKSVESSMVAESNKLSEKLKELVHKLETVESSRDTLSVKYISLDVKYNDLENQLVDRSLTETSRNEAVKSLEIEVDKLKQQIDKMTEVANREQSDLTTKLEMNRKEIIAVSMKAEENEIQRSATIEQLKQTIAKLNVANESLSNANVELTNQLSHSKISFESYQQSTDYKTEIEELIKNKEILNLRVNDLTCETEKLRRDLETARQENVSLTDENIDLATEIERVRKEYSASDESNRVEINSLKAEVNRLVATNTENHHRIEELQKEMHKQLLNDKLSYVQSQCNMSIASTNDLTVRLDDVDDSYAIDRSMTSPENLGKVVDIQLREQVLLYENLLYQYNSIQKEKSVLNEQIEERAQKISALESKCRQIEDENSSHVERYKDKLEELAVLTVDFEKIKRGKKSVSEQLRLARATIDNLHKEIDQKIKKIFDLERFKRNVTRTDRRELSPPSSTINQQPEISEDPVVPTSQTHRVVLRKPKIAPRSKVPRRDSTSENETIDNWLASQPKSTVQSPAMDTSQKVGFVKPKPKIGTKSKMIQYSSFQPPVMSTQDLMHTDSSDTTQIPAINQQEVVVSPLKDSLVHQSSVRPEELLQGLMNTDSSIVPPTEGFSDETVVSSIEPAVEILTSSSSGSSNVTVVHQMKEVMATPPSKINVISNVLLVPPTPFRNKSQQPDPRELSPPSSTINQQPEISEDPVVATSQTHRVVLRKPKIGPRSKVPRRDSTPQD